MHTPLRTETLKRTVIVNVYMSKHVLHLHVHKFNVPVRIFKKLEASQELLAVSNTDHQLTISDTAQDQESSVDIQYHGIYLRFSTLSVNYLGFKA